MTSFDYSARRSQVRRDFGVEEADWNDWRWQLRHRILTIPELARHLPLSPAEQAAATQASERFRFALTPYSLALIDPADPACPLRLQLVPSALELDDPEGTPDPLCELNHSPVPDLIHVYPDRVALCLTDVCQAYCRHCFRKRRTKERPPADAFVRAVDYIAAHPEIRDVLVTGGDPLMFSDRKLFARLAALRAIPHVEVLRLGTRAPSLLPMRITDELIAGLRQLHPLYINMQFNHPRELTPEVLAALARLADAGFPLGNQSVLLRGVNDSLPIMRELLHKLVRARVRPYYIFHPQLVEGTRHLRVPLEIGLDIHEGLEGFTSGLAVPLYILDTPYGKVPLTRSRLISRDAEGFTVRGFLGHEWREGSRTPLFP